MSALDFGSSGGNTSRYFTLAGPEIPAADWCMGHWLRLAGTDTAGHSMGCGSHASANTIQLYLSGSGSTRSLTLRLRGGGSGPDLTVSGIGVNNGVDYLVIAQRRGSSIELYVVAEDAAVAGPGATTTTLPASGSAAMTWHVGARPDLSSTRFWKNPFGELFFLSGDSLTPAEVQTLAEGRHITDLRATRALDLRFRGSNPTEPDLSGNGRDATMVGAGFTLADDFFPEPAGQLKAALFFGCNF